MILLLEAIWGADPLEAIGGFASIADDDRSSFKSSLARNATVGWTTLAADTQAISASGLESSVDFATCTLAVQHPEIDWTQAQDVYGWPGLQFQTWVRGQIINTNTDPKRVILFADNVLEYSINEQHYFGGDLYGFRKAPAVLKLSKGANDINLRIVNDIRASGAKRPPCVDVRLEVRQARDNVEFVDDGLLFPELVDGYLPTHFASATIRNHGPEAISIKACWAQHPDQLPQQAMLQHIFSSGFDVHMLGEDVVDIIPGQMRPIALHMTATRGSIPTNFTLCCSYSVHGSSFVKYIVSSPTHLESKDYGESHRMTFLHPSGVVSYAMLRPPAASKAGRNVPLLIVLHGAGVNADSDQSRHQLDAAGELPVWQLLPTGGTPWSADDWHTWGFADVQAAVDAVPGWLQNTQFDSPEPTAGHWIVAGHSNGGQGSWYLATHFPDTVLAVALVSGYSSIENYVPYTFWNRKDALKSAILDIARNSYHHESLIENILHLAVVQQHGSNDDNVPPYHTRLMNSLIDLAGGNVSYMELPGEGHWFDGVMTTNGLRRFYTTDWEAQDHRAISLPASYIVPSSADLGTWHGLEIQQLESPDQYGRIKLSFDDESAKGSWRIDTSNIHRFQIHPESIVGSSKNAPIFLDGCSIGKFVSVVGQSIVRHEGGQWQVDDDQTWRKIQNRYGQQRGTLDAILKTRGPFQLVALSPQALPLALQTSRNLFQYFGADSEILEASSYQSALAKIGNVISFSTHPDKVGDSLLSEFPLRIVPEGIRLRQEYQRRDTLVQGSPGLGAIFLRPLPDERLELVVWGWDFKGLQRVARLIPTVTGVGQPDFVVLDAKTGWEGHAGALALGFLDHSWNISAASYVQ